MKSQMTIGKKLILGYVAMLAAALLLAASSLYSLGHVGAELDKTVNNTGKKVALIGEIQANLFKMRSCQRGVMLFAIHNLPEKVQSNKQEFETRGNNVLEIVSELKPLLVTEAGRQAAAFIETELPTFREYFEQVAAAAMAGKAQNALSIYNERSVKSLDMLESRAEELVKLLQGLMADSAAEGAKSVSNARWTVIILMTVLFGLAPVLFLIVNRATQQLQKLAADLGEGAQQISSASGQVASSSQALAQGSSEQAASLEETSSSSQEITSMTQKNAENSQSAATVMAEVDQHVRAGNQTLEEMVVSMREITASSDKISKIIKVIDEIAFQTNILALNAAVEAARAGEAGMGFAVVADEVRNLAQRSAQAAKDTAALIEESISKSNEGSTKLKRVAEVIRAITASASQVKTLVDEVNLGSQEQSRGIQQISKALEQMDHVTQNTAASAEESASASEEMSAQADALHQIVASLRSLVGGEGDQRQPPAAKPNRIPPRPAAVSDFKKPKAVIASSRNVQPVKGPASSIPLEGDFVEM